MIGIALTEKLADTTESASETASEIVQDAEQKAGLLRQYMTDLLDWCMSKVGSLVVAVIFMVIGFRVVKWIIKLIKRTFDRSNMDVSVAGFLLSAIRILMNFIHLDVDVLVEQGLEHRGGHAGVALHTRADDGDLRAGLVDGDVAAADAAGGAF